jgi:hypothetical protein
MRSLSDGDCSELLTKFLRGQAAKTAQAIIIQLHEPSAGCAATRGSNERRQDRQSRPNGAINFESALTSTPDISLHRDNCRDGPGATVYTAEEQRIFSPSVKKWLGCVLDA